MSSGGKKKSISVVWACFSALTAYILDMRLTLKPQDELSTSDTQKDNKTLVGSNTFRSLHTHSHTAVFGICLKSFILWRIYPPWLTETTVVDETVSAECCSCLWPIYLKTLLVFCDNLENIYFRGLEMPKAFTRLVNVRYINMCMPHIYYSGSDERLVRLLVSNSHNHMLREGTHWTGSRNDASKMNFYFCFGVIFMYLT